MSKTDTIRRLNDDFRKSFVGGQVMMTQGICNTPNVTELLKRVRAFSDFSADNDPYGEHDFGSFHFEGETVIWKLDCYNLLLSAASPDPANPSVTCRVLTVMLADEY